MRRSFVWLVLLCWLGSCTLDSEEPQISCDIGFDTGLLENPPEDTVIFKLEAVDSRFNKIFIGVRRIPQLGNPIEGNYTNTFVYQRSPQVADQFLSGLGTTIYDDDTTAFTIAFNMQLTNTSDFVCRPAKTLQSDHEWSNLSTNKQGAEVRITIKINNQWMTLSTNGQQADGFLLDLEGAEFLDELNVYGRLKGTYAGVLQQINPPSATPLRVQFTGSFIFNTQFGYVL